LALDPQSIEAKNLLALALTGRVFNEMNNSRGADIARAKELSEESLALSPRSGLAHFAKGQVLRAEHRCDEPIPEYEMAIALNRNSANALFSLGLCKLLTGSIDETIQLEEQAINELAEAHRLGRKRVRIVAGMLPPASRPVTLQSTVPAHALGQVSRMRHDVVLVGGRLLKSPVRAGRFGGLIG
jgi:tetratricopeptide (TPR) repeat protein